MPRTTSTAVAMSLSALVLSASSAAFADPSGSRNSLSLPASCSDGSTVQDVTLVVNSANGQGSGTENNVKGQGNWTPAHLAGSTLVYHPTAFDLTFSFTTTDGQPFTFADTQTKPNGEGTVTCSISYTATESDGSFTINGTVAGYVT